MILSTLRFFRHRKPDRSTGRHSSYCIGEESLPRRSGSLRRFIYKSLISSQIILKAKRLTIPLRGASKEVVGIQVLLTRSLFGDGIPRRVLLRVSLAKPTSASLRF